MLSAMVIGMAVLALVGYFEFTDSALEQWVSSKAGQQTLMTYLPPIYITWIVLVTGSALFPLVSNSLRNRKLRARLKKTGQKTQAKVIGVEDTGITVNNNPYVKLVLEINGKKTELTTIVSRVALPIPGSVINVVYDPNDPTMVLPEHEMD
jgi:hypothetical protein